MRLVEATDLHFARLLGEPEAAGFGPTPCDDGINPPEVLAMLRALAAGLRTPDAPEGVAWLMVEDDRTIGLVGLKSAPRAEEVDFGYGVARAHEGRGHATAAVTALVELMRRSHVGALTAETSINNRGSQRVLEKNGFRVTGERYDAEDGALLLWRRELKGYAA